MVRVAWNTVGIEVPDSWDPAGLERDSLLLTSDDRPVCELKWNRVQGAFSFEKHLKRLSKGHKGADVWPVDAAETPEPWSEAVRELERAGLRLQSFMWRMGPDLGIGAALHNPGTGLAALVQFFINGEKDEDGAARVLASFRDHSGGRTVPWALFGLQARVPAEFRLETFSFKPGRYTVSYWLPRSKRSQGRLPEGKGPGTRLTFERFVPAGVLLRNTDLPTWLKETLKMPPTPLEAEDLDHGLAWAGVTKTSLLRKVLRRVHRAQARAWTAQPGNAILLVSAEGTVPVDETTFETIVHSYGLVQA